MKYLALQISNRIPYGKRNLVLVDALISAFFYKATFHDYMNLRFYIRSKNERKSFLTTPIVQAEKKKWPRELLNMVDDKGLFNRKYRKYVWRGWIDADEAGLDEIQEFVNRHETFFVKPKRESSGLGIKRWSRKEISDMESFSGSCEGMLLEEEVVSCEEMRKLNPGCTSQIRVVTVVGDGEVNVLATALRVGSGKVSFNTAADDLFIQIDPQTGICFTDAVDENGREYKAHPVSNIIFKGFQIPKWDDVINTCKEAALVTPEVRVIGWDVAITDLGITFFEGNPGSGVTSMQGEDGIGKKKLFFEFLK